MKKVNVKNAKLGDLFMNNVNVNKTIIYYNNKKSMLFASFSTRQHVSRRIGFRNKEKTFDVCSQEKTDKPKVFAAT